MNLAVPEGINRFRDLFKCYDCGSISIDPLPPHKELVEYYNKHGNIEWSSSSELGWRRRKSFKIILGICEKVKNGSILDIGCSDGQLLNMLPVSKKFGIDLSKNAIKRAKSKGISAICSSLESVTFSDKFDLIAALDFIEHIHNPRNALKIMSDILKPGGYLIIETGNADSFAARVLKEDWPYSSVYGHLNVLTPKSLTKIASDFDIEIIKLKKCCHEIPPIKNIIYRNILVYGFHVFKIFFRITKPLRNIQYFKEFFHHSPPGAQNRDHMIFIGKKKI